MVRLLWGRRRFIQTGAGLIGLGASKAAASRETVAVPYRIRQGQAITGDQFRTTESEYRLVDIRIPSAEGDAQASEIEEIAMSAKRVLQNQLTAGVYGVWSEDEKDRWGRRLIIWGMGLEEKTGFENATQSALVAEGLARVVPYSDHDEFLKFLLASEEKARRTKKGLWGLSRFRVFNAENANGAVGAYNIIEGSVREVYVGSRRTYLNFGDNYKTDFTATIPSRAHRAWRQRKLDPEDLLEKPVQVRGFVTWINGPSIECDHPFQIIEKKTEL